MVITIKEKKDLEPFPELTHSYLAPLPEITQQTQPKAMDSPPLVSTPPVAESNSITSESSSDHSAQSSATDSHSGTSLKSTTSIVKGFSPSHVSSSYRSIPLLTAPSSITTDDLVAANPSNQHTTVAPKKKAMFALGGSSGEDSLSEQNSMESNLQPPQLKKKSAIFTFGSSEDESSLPQHLQPKLLAQKKQTSFKEEVATRTIREEPVFDDDVFETDDEDEIDESAIDDDDDSSDWEDSVEDSGKSSIDDKSFFQRVDSRPHLPSRRSLITTMLHEKDRATALANEASKSTPAMRRSRNSPPNGPSLATSPDSDDASPLMMKGLKPIAEVPRIQGPSKAQPIIKTTTNTTPHQQALSPKTTRRNMLYTELTLSLRQNLLWERQQKTSTANAVLKRRHTAHDVANLKQYPERTYMKKEKDDKEATNSYNQYFGQGLGEYHAKGW
jgi:hypothetical protein